MRFGHENVHIEDYYGRMITAAVFDDDELQLTFDNGDTIRVIDDGQSCCERRYVRTDDDVEELVGKKLTEVDVRDGVNIDGGYEEHQVQFVHINAGSTTVVLNAHNEHNGYYGGFDISYVKKVS